MNQKQLQGLLASVMGQLHISSSLDEQQLDKLRELMGNTLLDEEAAAVTNQEFSFQSSDLFFSQNIASSVYRKLTTPFNAY
jgi:hypothetical protein